MNVTAEQVKELRGKTGAGIMDCKRALQKSNGDFQKAMDFLREKGLAQARTKAGRATSEGAIGSYIHTGGKIGVLIEVNCETDFVARTDQFQNLVKDLAMQVAASNPDYIVREKVPPEVIEKKKVILRKQAEDTGKPEKVIEKIVNGRLEKFYQEVCLMEQPFIRDPEKTVRELIDENIAKLGENIVVRRFSRYQLGV